MTKLLIGSAVCVLAVAASARVAPANVDMHSGAVARESKGAAMICLGERGKDRDREHGSNGQRGGDGFDPYGKDDPSGPKWGRYSGPENRYGGLGNRPEANERKEKAAREKAERDQSDRDDRD